MDSFVVYLTDGREVIVKANYVEWADSNATLYFVGNDADSEEVMAYFNTTWVISYIRIPKRHYDDNKDRQSNLSILWKRGE